MIRTIMLSVLVGSLIGVGLTLIYLTAVAR